jgi:hypothetical protein
MGSTALHLSSLDNATRGTDGHAGSSNSRTHGELTNIVVIEKISVAAVQK